MKSSFRSTSITCGIVFLLVTGASWAPVGWLGGTSVAWGQYDDDDYEDEGDEGYDEEDDERPGRTFLRNLGNALEQRYQNRQRGNQNPNQGGNPQGGNQNRQFPRQNNGQQGQNQNNNQQNGRFNNSRLNPGQSGRQRNWMNDVVQGLELLESQNDRYERDSDRLDRLRERMNHSQYERLVDAISKRIGSEDEEYEDYEQGWENRNNQWQQWQKNGDWNVEQKRVALDYVKYGDRPLESHKGVVPQPNPVLASPQAYDVAATTRLAKTIDSRLKDDVAGLRKNLPEGCRIDDAIALVERLKADGQQSSLIESLQAAIVDRDIRRFERNAQALLVPTEEIQRLLIGLTLENLQDKLEDNASPQDIAKITEPMVRRVEGAGLDQEFTTAFIAWLQDVPELLEDQRLLLSGKAAPATAWPEGEVKLVFDPQLSAGESRLLPGGLLAAAGNGESRVVLGSGNKFTANGIAVLKGQAAENAAKDKPQAPSLLLHYPGESGEPLKYTIICYQEVPTNVAGQFQPNEAWRQDYSITPGLRQPLELAANGRTWYQINCHSKDGATPAKAYTLKPAPGMSPTYGFSVSGNVVSLVSTTATVTLDNSQNARPFHFLLGNEQKTVRAGAKSTFDSGVTLQYARNGKTAVPKDANGTPIPNAAPEAVDISSITLRENDTGVIGVNAAGEWEVRPSAEVEVAQRKDFELPVAVIQHTEASKVVLASAAPTPRGKLYVLAVGISKYKNPKQFPNLSFADKDVVVLTDVLKKQKKSLFTDVETTVVANAEATAIKIRTELIGLERKATKNDTVALILSGHGVIEKGSYYFCPHDTEQSKLARQGISCDELQKVTDNLSAKNVFVFLDSCYSGGATDKLQEGFKKQVSRVGDSGVVIFASSKGTESSQEDATWGHGALTKAFLDTIANPDLDLNKDNILQVAELDRGMTEGIKKLTSGGQHLQSAELGDSIRNLSLVQLLSE